MKILYVQSFREANPPLGGIETYGIELSRSIEQRGHKVSRLHLYGPDIVKNFTLTDRLPRIRHAERYYWWKGVALQDYRYHNALARLSGPAIAAFAPDVIHCTHCYLGASVLRHSVPFIASCYGLEVVDCPPIRKLLQNATAVHSISEFTRVRAALIAPNAAHRVLSWGIPSGSVCDRQSIDFDLITVGRVVRRKNIDTVIRALRRAPDLRYAVVGDGPELGALKALAAEYGLSNITFLGAVSDARRHELLCRSRLFVMCPRNDRDDVEGLGIVYYEAQAAGLPCIAAISGGAGEAVGTGGVLVDDPLDDSAVLSAIRGALNREAYERLRLAVAERQKTHSWAAFVDGFERLYDQVRIGEIER